MGVYKTVIKYRHVYIFVCVWSLKRAEGWSTKTVRKNIWASNVTPHITFRAEFFGLPQKGCPLPGFETTRFWLWPHKTGCVLFYFSPHLVVRIVYETAKIKEWKIGNRIEVGSGYRKWMIVMCLCMYVCGFWLFFLFWLLSSPNGGAL